MRNITPGQQKRFSTREVREIMISVIVLSLAFMVMFCRSGSVKNYFEYYLGNIWVIGMFLIMFVLVMLSFVLHEMGHKFVAQDMGYWSEYRMYPMGLFLSLVISMFGFLIAAPGAVYISGRNISGKDNGKISIAGPLVNMVLAVIGIAGCLLLNHSAFVVPFYLLMSLNGSLALFNMLPFPPLDGSKILAWDKKIYFVCLAISVLLFASFWLMPTLYWA
ncbi:site-2 protease family protein [Methanomethylophilus alvi]|uniref:site-2 protease family protein n=1 Tax=Methanomethylophilus alvi TaxID=1291540 RepID=UPI0037DDC669